MIADLRRWFLGRSRREQGMLLVLGALVAVTLVWAAIILPVTDGLADAKARYADAADRLGDTRARLAALKGLNAGAARFGQALDAEVRARADAAGFVLAQDDALGSDRVHVTIASARPAALFGWVAALEEAGLLVEALKVGPNGDGTLTVDLTLAARAG